MTDYDRLYRETADYFGTEPSPLLEQFKDHIPPDSPVLEIGVGQGRNALPLARQGLAVTGIDISSVAIDGVGAIARREKLPLELWHGSFLDFEPPAGTFGTVLAFGLMQTCLRREGAALLFRLREWTRPGGVIFLSAWHVDDPSYGAVSETWTRVGLHSFQKETGEVRTFLARGEIRDLLIGWGVLHCWEGMTEEHSHGDGPPEQHGAVELVAVRTA